MRDIMSHALANALTSNIDDRRKKYRLIISINEKHPSGLRKTRHYEITILERLPKKKIKETPLLCWQIVMSP